MGGCTELMKVRERTWRWWWWMNGDDGGWWSDRWGINDVDQLIELDDDAWLIKRSSELGERIRICDWGRSIDWNWTMDDGGLGDAGVGEQRRRRGCEVKKMGCEGGDTTTSIQRLRERRWRHEEDEVQKGLNAWFNLGIFVSFVYVSCFNFFFFH